MTIVDSGFMIDNGASCVPCTPEEEKRVVDELTNESELNLREGNLFYVVSSRWFISWKRYVEQGSAEDLMEMQSSVSQSLNEVPSLMAERPGPIDNSDIILNGGSEGDDLELIRTLEEGTNYVLVPQNVWEKLFDWYKGGPALPRKLIMQGVSKKSAVEVFPLCLNLIDSRDNSHTVVRLSKKASISDLYEKVSSLRAIEKEKVHIWDYFNKKKHAVLQVANQTLEEANLQMDQEVLLEVKGNNYCPSVSGVDSTGNELALVPLEPSRSTLSIAGGPTMSNGHKTVYSSTVYDGSSYSSAPTDLENDISNYSKKGEKGGLAGLQNLGNTCFMNSALQCLVHTPPLFEYFLEDYTKEINSQNPLGMRGELALAFGELLRKLWSSGRSSIAPRVFKGKLARFAPQFSGYNQHDSQELLAFLLDGLHEDLNRVKQKPYIESKDSNGRPDEEVADECWKNHKARNDSVIVDVCQGQYKSTLVCPVCSKISITFDPFMYLSLPVPSTATRTMTVTVIYGDGSGLPMPFTVNVLKQGSCRDLIQALATACCLKNDESLLLADVYEHKVFRYYECPSDPLSSIKDDDHFVAYRVPKDKLGKVRVEVNLRLKEKSASDHQKYNQNKLFGTPLVTYLEDPVRGADVYVAVSRMMSPFRRTYIPQSSKDNDSVSDGTDEPMSSGNAQSELGNQSTEIMELDEAYSEESTLKLSLTQGLNCEPVEEDSVIKYGEHIKFMIDWTYREHELYNISHLENLPVVFKPGFTVKKTRQESISLFSCLEEFMKEEPLGPDDMWYCPSCKEHRQATKKLDLWRLPDILVFHLKRFSYTRFMKNKIDAFVSFPVHNLDLSRHVISKDGESHVYELFAISNHYGGLGGGHYTAYAKLIDENRWYHFDDSHVSQVEEGEIKTGAAYVLFYQRVKNGEPKVGIVGEASSSSSSQASASP